MKRIYNKYDLLSLYLQRIFVAEVTIEQRMIINNTLTNEELAHATNTTEIRRGYFLTK